MKKTIERGEKIMKGRFFTLIIGLSLVVGNAWAADVPKIASGSIPVNIYGGGYSITLPTQNFDLSKQGGAGGTGTSISCRTPIPALEMFKVGAGIHAVNKYTQLQTTKTTFDYLKTMGIYGGMAPTSIKFDKNGISLPSGLSKQFTGYFDIQSQMIDSMASNPMMAMMIMGGSSGSSGGMTYWGGSSNMWSLVGGMLR